MNNTTEISPGFSFCLDNEFDLFDPQLIGLLFCLGFFFSLGAFSFGFVIMLCYMCGAGCGFLSFYLKN